MRTESLPPLQILLFGPFCVQLDGVTLESLTRRQMALLALLALHPDQSLNKEWVIEQLWPSEGRSMTLLNKLVHDVHDAIRPFPLDLAPRDGMLRLDTTDLFVDTLTFDRAWESREADGDALDAALELYRGPLLLDWENWYDREWANRARETYAQRYREALRWLASRALANGDFEGGMQRLQALRERGDPAESLHSRLMDELMNTEQFVLASRLYEEYRDLVRETKSLLPPRAMTERYEQIPRISGHFDTHVEPALVEEEPIGGGMRLDSRYYVTRPSDAVVHTAVKRRDGIVRIEGPRQTGKTSLLARALEQARQEGALVVTTDFQALGPEDTATIGSLFLALAQQFHRAAKTRVAPSAFWDPMLSANMNFEGYLLEVVMSETSLPIVWGIDEADRIFDREYRSSVFGLFRSWHNRRSLSPDEVWRRFTLIMAYSAEARMLIPNPNESPFNVGTEAILQDFSAEQTADLNRRYAEPVKTDEDLARLRALVGGHPYLIRRCLYEMKTRPATLVEIEGEARRDNGLFREHLDRIWRIVSLDPERRQVALSLLQGKLCEDPESFSRLRSAGVLAGDSMREARFRCSLYAEHLEKRLL